VAWFATSLKRTFVLLCIRKTNTFVLFSQAYEAPGCPSEGGVVGTFGATANQACCYCAATIPEIPGGITIPSKIPGEGTIPQATISSGNRWEVSVSIGLVSLFLSWMHK